MQLTRSLDAALVAGSSAPPSSTHQHGPCPPGPHCMRSHSPSALQRGTRIEAALPKLLARRAADRL